MEQVVTDFEIITCRSNCAGEASVSLRQTSTGAVVTMQKLPFDHVPEEPDAECTRIAQVAADVGRAASDFLASQTSSLTFTREYQPGAGPNEDEPANSHGQAR
jgi:hypothetical protein